MPAQNCFGLAQIIWTSRKFLGPIEGQGIREKAENPGNPGTPGPVFQDPGNPGPVIQDPGKPPENPQKKSGGFSFPERCKKDDCIFHITWKEFKKGFLQFTVKIKSTITLLHLGISQVNIVNRNTDTFSFSSGGTITDGHTENEKIVADKIDDLLNIQFQPLSNGYNQYFFVRKEITEDIEGNDINLDTEEISRLNFSIILTDPPDSNLSSESGWDNNNSFCVAFWQN